MNKVLHVYNGVYKRGQGIFSVLDWSFRFVTNFEVYLYCREFEGKDLPYKIYTKDTIQFDALLRIERFDFVVFHGVFFIEYSKMSSVCRSNRIKYFIKPHGSLVRKSWSKSPFKKSLFYIFYLHRFLRYSHSILFINNEEAAKSFHNKKFILDFNYIGYNRNYNFRKSKDDKMVRFFFYSRFDFQHKGLDILLDALKALNANKYPNFEFNFYGSGSVDSVRRLKKELKLINSSFITYKGHIENEDDLQQMFLDNDILVLTSRYEGFPTVISEAMFFGIPPLVTKETNSEFILDEGIGWQVTLDSKDVVQKIEDILTIYPAHSKYIISRCQNFAHKNILIDSKLVNNQYEKLLVSLEN
ncbi:MAG: glycosyltransferase [Sediminibacterium sp.]